MQEALKVQLKERSEAASREASSRRVVLGMSGGVDSSVSAALLLEAGFEPIGLTCIFTRNAKTDAEIRDAAAVCSQLGIEHVVRDCSSVFSSVVIEPFIAAYREGLTPNPCICCNAACKFPSLFAAAQDLGCAMVATGHYARIARSESGRFAVCTAADSSKDQSYMLARLSQEQLSRIVLPLGSLTKISVRQKAADLGFAVAEKPDSQDICFIEGNPTDFLAQHDVTFAPGEVVDLSGRCVGQHQGLARYTIGQRKGIGIAASEPYYVVGKDAARNRLIVGFQRDAYVDRVSVRFCVWQAIEPPAPGERLSCEVKLRYRSARAAASLCMGSDGMLEIELDEPQAATAPGQHAVFYRGDTVLGSGIIERVERA